MSKKVILLKIDDYNPKVLGARVREALDMHFPLPQWIKPHSKILLKPNLLMAATPEEAVTTHPVFIEVVGQIFQEAGYPVSIADSPGGFISDKDVAGLYEELGLTILAQRNNFELLFPTESFIDQELPLCWWSRGFTMINLPKLKTHEIMVLTLATKNLYGCISGLHKSHLHHMHPQTDSFAYIITKLYRMLNPPLSIVDGILAMEGHGPAKKGKPRKLGLVAIGNDALYTDYVISRFLSLPEAANPLVRQARREGLFELSELEYISEFDSNVTDFNFPPPFIINRLPAKVVSLLKSFFKFRPTIDISRCTACAMCVRVCPQKAITMKVGKATIDHSRCIMCMCCGEMCRFGAVDIDKSAVLKILDMVFRRGKNGKT
ncbi:MAG: DUF362 domain-containing protein [Candidatus Omnitrophota bacterium]|nr:DUF362 domain-containing protein [Candidatus Omnitrophota bacterium]